MEDGNKSSQAFGGQQRNQHPRPFFYVQPPTQPYYLYQPWQLNNPYGQYGLPAGFNYARPCMPPYQPYMQYPGFVFPQSPMYPIDCRRMFEPRFQNWNEAPRQQNQPRREMASSEAQTDPNEAITKLIECLDKMQTDAGRVPERELDSGVASQSSAISSPEDVSKRLDQNLSESCLESPAVVFSISTTAVYDGESSHRSLDMMSPRECWSGGLEEELPLDSSSVHEDLLPAVEDHFRTQEVVADVQTDVCATERNPQTCDHVVATCPSTTVPTATTDGGKASYRTRPAADSNFQILKLPFDGVSGATVASRISSPASPYYYNYLSLQTTHERMSVLSPSLDELSSRDEMFSTDLDDVDLFPKQMYTGRRFAEAVSELPADSDEVLLPRSKCFMCACCGKNLTKGSSRSKGLHTKMHREEVADSEDERYGHVSNPQMRVVVRKHLAPKKNYSVFPRHSSKPWYKKAPYQDAVDQEDTGKASKPEAEREGALPAGAAAPSLQMQCGSCLDGGCREDVMPTDKKRWGDTELITRRRTVTPLSRPGDEGFLQKQGPYRHQEDMGSQRIYNRGREEDDAIDPAHWDRASKPREPRC